MLHDDKRTACADQINLAQDREKCPAVVNAVIKRALHKMPEIATLAQNLLDSQARTDSFIMPKCADFYPTQLQKL